MNYLLAIFTDLLVLFSSDARIHIGEISWEVREDWAPNISTAGYIDVEVVQSELMVLKMRIF
jgi:hypothetical protein